VNKQLITELKKSYRAKKEEIERRLSEFEKLSLIGTEEEIFYELCFCLLTPQSKAKVCLKVIEDFIKGKILSIDSRETVAKNLWGVRFKNNKAGYILNAKNLFLKNGTIEIKSKINGFKNAFEAREWLVKNVKGIGYKEASHFLRNIGLGENLAILDRHILKNLKVYGVIDEIPRSLSRKKYIEIEDKMKDFSRNTNIPLSHLDLLFWSRETGKIFK